ncbi:molybdopterin-guanine dinucleotide biosynthesis protein MobB [bacterium]|nr:molybdopterin-guanine dinucleotide biosynthesis protein MobB [bacterium]
MKKLPRIVSVIGWSGSGKTTFIEGAIGECARRGVSAAAIKKSRHAADLPPDAKDSSRFRAAGALPSIYLSDTEMVVLAAPPAVIDAGTIAALCPGAAIVFCEGLAVPGSIAALVAGEAEDEAALKRPLAEIDILVARAPGLRKLAAARGVPAFAPEDIGRIIDRLLA